MRAVTLAAKSPIWSYYMQTRIVAPTLAAAIEHARAANEMWRHSFVVVSDVEAGEKEQPTEPGTWPRGKFDMEGFLASNKRVRVVPAVAA